MSYAFVCVEDFISGPFKTDRIEIFKDGSNADTFFRPALRSLMVSLFFRQSGS